MDLHATLLEATDPTEAPAEPEAAQGATEEVEAQTEETAGDEGEEGSAEDSEQDAAAAEKESESPGDLDPFSDEALSTPEGIKTAREQLQEDKRKLHHQYLRTKKREQKLSRQRDQWVTERNQQKAFHEQILADLQALQRGDASTVMQTLGRITGRPALELYNEISENLARNGQRSEHSELSELRAEIRAMREQRQQEQDLLRAQAERQGLQQQFEAKLQEVGEQAKACGHDLVEKLAQSNPRGVAEQVAQMLQVRYESGDPIDVSTAFGALQEELETFRDRLGLAAATAPSAETGRDTGTPTPEKKAPRPPGRAIKAGTTARATRPRTESEAIEALANTPGLIENLF